MQTNKSLIFDKNNMSLSGQSINCLEKGLAKRIENLSCNNGCLKSVNIADDLFEKIEPQKSELLRNKFLEKGDCLWITIYSTIQNSVEIDYVVFCTTDYRVYYYNSQDESPAVKELIPVPFSSEPIFEYFIKDGTNTMLLCSKTDEMWVWNGVDTAYEVLDAPKIKSLAVGFDRVFVVDQNNPYSILFSDDMDPSNWSMTADEAGEIVFNDNMGKVIGVFALDNYIFVVRDHGIIKLSSYKSASNSFTVSRMFTATGKIFHNTVCVCGDKVLFLCVDGLYSFDGLTAKKIYSDCSDLIFGSEFSSAVCVNNIYYLCTTVYDNHAFNNALFVFLVDSSSIDCVLTGNEYSKVCELTIADQKYAVLLSADSKSKTANTPVILCKNGAKLQNCENFVYLSHEINLEPKSKIKAIKSITVRSKFDVYFDVITASQTKTIFVKGSEFFQTILVGLSSQTFALKVYGSGDAFVDGLRIDYSFVE